MSKLFDYRTASLLIPKFEGGSLAVWEDADDNLQLRLEIDTQINKRISRYLADRFCAIPCEGQHSFAVVCREISLEWTTPIEMLRRHLQK